MTGDVRWYLYAVVGAVDAAGLRVGTGVDGAEVVTVSSGPLAAVASQVPSNRYDDQALRSNLADLDWLAETARAHHAVVDAISAATAVAPLRMGTLARDPDTVRELLDANRQTFTQVLDRVRGRREWGVKAYLTDPTAGEDEAQQPAGARPGTAYLQRRRGERDRARRALHAASERAQLLHETLSGHAADARTYPPQDPKLSGHPEPMVLNAAYLVGEPELDEFRAALAGFDPIGLHVELTGPWAPYSFTEDTAS